MSSKISSIVLWAIIIISLVALGAFYFGGSEIDANGNNNPYYTETLIYWMYVLFGLALVVTIGASVIQFALALKDDTKNALKTLATIICFATVIVIAWVIGDDTPLVIRGYEGTDNVPFWLKLTDMNLFSSYALVVIAILCILWGSIKKRLS